MAWVLAELGFPAMPWQRDVLEVGFELLENGLPAYREVDVTVPRQQGKTTLVLGVEVHRAEFWIKLPQRVYYSAQTGWDGHKKLLDDQVPILRASPLNTAVRQYRRGAGDDGVIFNNGSRIDVMASGESSGHGKVVDLAVVDEAFSDVDDRREQAMIPAMMTRRDAQLWVTSTAGHEGSAYLKRKVDTGRAAVVDGFNTGIAYFEWSADPNAPIDDPATWHSCMPALGITITEEVVRNALATMPEGEFRRAFLNQWTVGEERIIPAVVWNACCADDVKPDGGLVFGVDASPERTWASIVACDGEKRCELIEHRPLVADHEGMTVIDRVATLVARWSAQVAIDARGPAASLIPELEERGVTVEQYGAGEMAGATGRLYDALADRLLTIRRNPDLDLAVAGARKRVSGDQWYWARSSAHVDVSPLVALTLAYDLAVSSGRTAAPWVQWA